MIRRTIVTLVSVLALALTASAPAQATTTYDTRVTVNAKPEPVAKNRTITVTGSLRYYKDGRWRVPTTRVLAVVFDPSGTDGPRQVATVTTASDGSYARAFTASRSGKWTVKFGGSSSLQPHSASDAVCVYASGRWQCPVSSTNPDLDCPDIGRTVWVGSRDYHRLDADGDGWGCDAYSY
ncbi:hypothetical protein [Promicromonospora soli]|uniref:Excalibur calcium-binding domain-containing protein n=1 Tax=Promicromonospora soli TaxID=2035533 RepID=A0A919KP58_9MICO|nr:hypothetical protein [Promicromonospora soli]GHH67007.1 hypothetical protein GCM10017772_07930 [Promicromonospora soli]